MSELDQSNTLSHLVNLISNPFVDSQDPSPFADALRILIETSLEAQREAHLQCAKHQRSRERSGYRNGFKKRTLRSRFGDILVNIPQVRDCDTPFHPIIPCFEQGSRVDRSLSLTIAEMYFQGVSTRKVAAIFRELTGGQGISATYVSRCCAKLDASFEQWRNRPIPPILHLFLDATYCKVRRDGHVCDCAILIAIGLCADTGKKIVLGVSCSLSEASQHWRDFIESLKARGMNRPLCITSDDHAGLRSAIAQTLTGVPWQRCQFHFQQNAAAYVTRQSLKPLVASSIRSIFDAPDLPTATLTLRSVLSNFRAWHQDELADWVEENIHECLTVLSFPAEIRRHICTSNCMENFNKQLKRRAKVVSIFPHKASLLRMATAIAMDVSDEWEGTFGRSYVPPDIRTKLLQQATAAPAPPPFPAA